MNQKQFDAPIEFIMLDTDKKYFERFGIFVQYGNLIKKAEEALTDYSG